MKCMWPYPLLPFVVLIGQLTWVSNQNSVVRNCGKLTELSELDGICRTERSCEELKGSQLRTTEILLGWKSHLTIWEYKGSNIKLRNFSNCTVKSKRIIIPQFPGKSNCNAQWKIYADVTASKELITHWLYFSTLLRLLLTKWNPLKRNKLGWIII